jgi:hypothetical protein
MDDLDRVSLALRRAAEAIQAASDAVHDAERYSERQPDAADGDADDGSLQAPMPAYAPMPPYPPYPPYVVLAGPGAGHQPVNVPVVGAGVSVAPTTSATLPGAAPGGGAPAPAIVTPPPPAVPVSSSRALPAPSTTALDLGASIPSSSAHSAAVIDAMLDLAQSLADTVVKHDSS